MPPMGPYTRGAKNTSQTRSKMQSRTCFWPCSNLRRHDAKINTSTSKSTQGCDIHACFAIRPYHTRRQNQSFWEAGGCLPPAHNVAPKRKIFIRNAQHIPYQRF